MKSGWLLSLLLVAAIALSACQVSDPAPTVIQAEEAYPAPALSDQSTEQESYPAPEALMANSIVLYPDATDGDEVTWSQAIAMIMNEEVKQVILVNAPRVTLLLKDGRSLITVETTKGAVLLLIDQCAEKCEAIEITTE